MASLVTLVAIPRIAAFSLSRRRRGLAARCCSKSDEEQRKIKLQQLDNQLEGLSSTRSPPRISSVPPPSRKSDKELEVAQFPEVESAFFLKFAAILFLITIVNNLLFIAFFPNAPKDEPGSTPSNERRM